MRHCRWLPYLLKILFLLASTSSFSQASAGTPTELESVRDLLTAQQAQIEALQASFERQQRLLDSQQALLASMQIAPAGAVGDALPQQLPKSATPPDPGTANAGTVVAGTGSDPAPPPRGEDIPEDPKASVADLSFPGAWRLPGSSARMRIGGYVKMNFVQSFDQLVTRDRFIVGSIPPSGETVEGATKGFALTAKQSRVNLDMRDETEFGAMRAFVEGDFAGSGETFRLRHAYGQFRYALAGKSWSTLMDLDASPEELDFEGINGRIKVRQSQLRLFPRLTDGLNFSVALEDPAPDVSGGTGVSELPDVVIGIDRSPVGLLNWVDRKDGWSMRTALIGRQIKARVSDVGRKHSTMGWGVTTSGRIPMSFWAESDQFLWQLTYGEGIGRYINDLGAVGGQDAVFAPDGKLKALPVFAGYLSYQHWWNSRWRSNSTLSWVMVDDYDFQSTQPYEDLYGPAYEQTLRASINLLFNPVQRVELGAELLWGERKNGDGSSGSASQLQISARYLY